MSGHDIFISYSRQERAAARLFAESFAAEGFSVWWDAVLHSGETFDEVIERELRAAKAVVVLWSPRSVASRWVRAEATQADRSNKLVPVVIEPCDRPIIFELTHTAELQNWKGDRTDVEWQTLVSDLRRLIGPAKAAALPEAVQPDIEPEPTPQAVEPVKEEIQAEKSPEPQKAGDPVFPEQEAQDELAKALERLAQRQASALSKPTPDEEAAAEFFKRSDEFRSNEGEEVHCLRRVHAPDYTYYVVGPEGLKIGRTAPADVIVFEPSVSRAHCVVELAADKVRVMDLNSTNGTYIDDKRVGTSEILPVGSVLRVGNVAFEHEIRTRAEIQQLNLGDLKSGPEPRESRIA